MSFSAVTPLTKRWQVAARLPAEADQALSEFPDFMRQILYNRGIDQAEAARAFLEARTYTPTDPFLLTGMHGAVERLRRAVVNKEMVAIYGDYDVDGVTAAVLMVEALKVAGAEVRLKIPNRFDEGYGLNKDALDNLYKDNVRLVVTVDCGVRSPSEAEFARSLGLDLIITDHHQPDQVLPQAIAIINPRQPGDQYPEKELAGVGLAYKIAQAYFTRYPQAEVVVEDWLDLVALGTVADMAPLLGENREMVAGGLKRIRKPIRQGLASLGEVARLPLERTTSTDIGFVLGPRLNAAGRLDSAVNAYELLSSSDPVVTGRLAQLLDVQNSERQQITREIQAQAEAIAALDKTDSKLIFAVAPQFNEGVVGLAASRLVDTFYRPTIVGHRGEELTRASCRSIPEFNITQALDQCAELLVRHGGHKMAAGFTVSNGNLPELVSRLQDIARQQLAGVELQPTLRVDLPLSLSRPDGKKPYRVFNEIQKLQPCGQGNPEPLFVSRNLRVRDARKIGKEQNHLRLKVDENSLTLDAVAWRQGHWADHMPDVVDIIYSLEMNDYMGDSRIQLNVRDMKASGT